MLVTLFPGERIGAFSQTISLGTNGDLELTRGVPRDRTSGICRRDPQ